MAANQLKSKKKESPAPASKPPQPAPFKKDREVEVSVKDLVRDERTHKVLGILCLLVSLYLFLAFSSYLFSWQDDQAAVLHYGASLLLQQQLRVENLLGRLGAYTAHVLIFEGVGISAYLLSYLFLLLGINAVVGRPVFKFWKNLRLVIFGWLYLSTVFSFVFQWSSFPWGGAMGDFLRRYLSGFVGTTGLALLLVVLGLAFLIIRYNLDIRMPRLRRKKAAKPDVALDQPLAEEDPEFWNAEQEVVPQTLGRQEDLPARTHVSVTLPSQEPRADPSMLDMSLVEKLPVSGVPVDDPIAMDPAEAKQPEPAMEQDLPMEGSAPLRPGKGGEEEVPLEIRETQPDEVEVVASPSQKLVDANGLYDPSLDLSDYRFPSLDLLENHGGDKIVHDNQELENNKKQIIDTLRNYDISIQKITATVGPTVTLYEIVPTAGVRISRIRNLEDDIALSLSALGIRIIAPIPGKGTIGIEVPNVKRSIVSMKVLLASDKFQHTRMQLPVAIGKKIDNENFIVDLASMPHLLMAGATGQGKSVGINAVLVSLLYKMHPSQLKFVLVDPKKVELSIYRVIEKHFLAKLPGEDEPIITDTKKVIHTLNALCIEMDNRYDLLKEAGARNIREYNDKFIHRKLNPQKGHQFLPFIVLVVDEFADLIMTAGKEVEMPIARLAQLARAVGIHLVIATQRPSVNIITGTIKANFPARIAFKVSSKVDSRTILDTGGAEQLIGKGDMLISYNGDITRLQCAFVDTPEVESVVDFIGAQRGYPNTFMLPEFVDEKEAGSADFGSAEVDKRFGEAARYIVETQQGSTSLLQRRMKLGYNRAGRLMDQLEAAGIVGPNAGSKAREVLVKTMTELEEILGQLDV